MYNIFFKIELMRKRLNDIAERYGIQHPFTLAYSRKLDKLIVEVQRGIVM